MRQTAGAFLCALAACLAVTSGHLHAPDDEVLFRLAQSIARHGSLAIEPITHGFGAMKGRDGREYPQYGVGQALLAVPLVWAGGGLARLLGPGAQRLVLASDTASVTGVDPREICERFCVSFFNAFVTAALTAMLFAFCLRITGDSGAAWATALAYGLATLALAHSRTFFTEPLATLCVFGAFMGARQGARRRSLARLALGGAFAGASALVRVDSVVAWPALAGFLLWELAARRGGGGRVDEVDRVDGMDNKKEEAADRTEGGAQSASFSSSPRSISSTPSMPSTLSLLPAALAFLAPMAAGAACVAALNWWRFGSFFQTGYSDQPEGVQFATPVLVGLHGLLFSPGRGLIFFSPPLILALWAFGSFYRRDRRAAVASGVLAASVLLFHAHWINWSGGWCWGPRHIYMIHVFLALPIAAWLAERAAARWRRAVFAGLFVAGLCVQSYGCSQDYVAFYRVMFQTTEEAPSFHALYSWEEEAWLRPRYELSYRDDLGHLQPIPFPYLGAPINDSLYVPQNSCWYGYADMARAGWNDFLWLRLMGIGSAPR